MSVSYVDEMKIDLGEHIHVLCEVKPVCGQDIPFEITEARYELLTPEGELEDSGECAINGHQIDAYISPQTEGTGRLKLIYKIADETWVDNIKLRVG